MHTLFLHLSLLLFPPFPLFLLNFSSYSLYPFPDFVLPPSSSLPPQFFLHIDVWSDACSSGLVPSSTSLCREALSQHKALRERYQLMYNTTRSEGHRLLEKLKKPVGDSRCGFHRVFSQLRISVHGRAPKILYTSLFLFTGCVIVYVCLCYCMWRPRSSFLSFRFFLFPLASML